MNVTQTVDIPADRWITVEVPPQIPAGRVVLTFSPAVELAAEEDSVDEFVAVADEIIANHIKAFKALAK